MLSQTYPDLGKSVRNTEGDSDVFLAENCSSLKIALIFRRKSVSSGGSINL